MTNKVKIPKVLRTIMSGMGIVLTDDGEADIFDLMNLLASKQDIDEDVVSWIRLIQQSKNLTRYRFVTAATVAPFGSESDKDCIGEFFSARTDFRLGRIPSPPVIYAHGHDVIADGASTEILGEVISIEIDPDKGLRYLIGFYGEGKFADEVLKAYLDGALRFSTRSVQKQRADNGEILVWLVGEVSVFTSETIIAPCNLKALADGPAEGQDATPDQVWMKWVIELQPQEMREELIKALINPEVQEAFEDGLPPVSSNNAPNANVVDIAEHGEGEEQVTKEEVAAMISEGMASMKKCDCSSMSEKGEKAVEEVEYDATEAKGNVVDITTAIKAKAAKMTGGAALQANAALLVDAAGVAPAYRIAAIGQVASVLESMDFAKGESVIDTLLAGYQAKSAPMTGATRLGGFQAQTQAQDAKVGVDEFKRFAAGAAQLRSATANKGGAV